MSALKIDKLYEDALFNHLILKGYNHLEAKVFVEKMFENDEHQFNIDFFKKVMKKENPQKKTQ
ncbi:MAG: hypothetical protein R6U21_03410 [Thermoplasmatota archaeon]